MFPTTLLQTLASPPPVSGSAVGGALRARRYNYGAVQQPLVWSQLYGNPAWFSPNSPALRSQQQETDEARKRRQSPQEATGQGMQAAQRLLVPGTRPGTGRQPRAPGTNLPATGLDAVGSPFAATLPGRAGHASVNVIDQQGALDPTGRTVDGNNAAGVRKLSPSQL